MIVIKFKKLFFVLQFAFILIPFTFIADIVYYAFKEDSLSDGLAIMVYDSMLNCSDDDWSRILTIILLIVSVISVMIYQILKRRYKTNDVKDNV